MATYRSNKEAAKMAKRAAKINKAAGVTVDLKAEFRDAAKTAGALTLDRTGHFNAVVNGETVTLDKKAVLPNKGIEYKDLNGNAHHANTKTLSLRKSVVNK